MNQVLLGDCLELIKDIPTGTVDMVLCDLPYGTTACKWDVIIPFEPLWEQYNRIIKNNGAIVLTSSQPFTTKLISSNYEMFKYQLIWVKEKGVNFQLAKNQPLKIHEDINVFGKSTILYNPQDLKNCYIVKSNKNKGGNLGHLGSEAKREKYIQTVTNYPTSILKFKSEVGLHPTQKPIKLFEYLIKTYTNEGETVLDNCAGSGTTAIACLNTDRNYICMEKEELYFKVINDRIEEYVKKPKIKKQLF